MPIYQRGKNKTWWIDYTDPNGNRVRQSSGTENKQQAQELHDQLKAESWRIKNLGAKPRHSWQDAVIRWLTEMGHKKSIETDLSHLRFLNDYLGNLMLDSINKSVIDTVRTAKQKTGASNATVNRVTTLIIAILNKAKSEWEWLDTAPTIKRLPEPSCRVRWLTHDEVDRLLIELPPHLSAMVRFSLATGLRESNVTKLQWSQLDMQRRCAWVHADNSKSGKAIAVPLNDDALQVVREQIGKHNERVFSYKGLPVNDANTKAWRHALTRAGIENFRWHDLRHTWASWHIQNGTPINVLRELGGWSDLSMVLRYAHLSSEHLSQYAGNSEKPRCHGTDLSQTIKKA